MSLADTLSDEPYLRSIRTATYSHEHSVVQIRLQFFRAAHFAASNPTSAFLEFFGAFLGGNGPRSRYFTRSISQKCQL